ncbi:MAG: hypothetical protein ACKPKO_12915, partial [Candidatus Fonsibacter sp.]
MLEGQHAKLHGVVHSEVEEVQYFSRLHDDVKRALQETAAERSALRVRTLTIGESHSLVASQRDTVLRNEPKTYEEREVVWTTELHKAKHDLSEVTEEHEQFRNRTWTWLTTEWCGFPLS